MVTEYLRGSAVRDGGGGGDGWRRYQERRGYKLWGREKYQKMLEEEVGFADVRVTDVTGDLVEALIREEKEMEENKEEFVKVSLGLLLLLLLMLLLLLLLLFLLLLLPASVLNFIPSPQKFSAGDFQDVLSGWRVKKAAARDKLLAWGLIRARKKEEGNGLA